MAQSIILKRSSLPGKVPDTGSLNAGELAINTYDGKIFIKRSGNLDSIQSVLTTDSITTGSITLTHTASIGELIVTQDANIQRDLFVIRDIITNNDIDAGGDISGSGLQVNDTLNIIHGQFNLSASTSITGAVGINGDLTVLGAVNARQFNINVISSSIIYQSGSTKFGDTIDDTHQFTGSVDVSGSIILNGVQLGGSSNSGSFTGSFSGDGSGLRGVVSDELPIDGWDYDSNSSASISDFNVTSSKYIIDFEWDTEVGTPIGHKTFISNVTGSTQIVPTEAGIKFIVGNQQVALVGPNGIESVPPAGTVSGSSQLTSSYDSRYVLSGSITQTTWDNIASKPSGIVSGSSQVINILSSLNTFTASISTASLVTSIDNLNTFTASQSTASLVTSISNLNTFSGSQLTKNSSLETITGSLILTASNLTQRVSSIELISGTFATTGSNTFFGTQTYSGSVYIANDLIVQGSSSIQYISASSVSIGTNIVQLNTANPSIRYAGLSITDSGSVGGSGSFLYDSVQDEFIFVHRGNGINVTSSHFVLGPETIDNLGNETYLTNNRLPKGTGKEHLVDSNITDSGTLITLGSNTTITGTLVASGTTLVSGSSQISFTGIIDKPTLVSGSSQIDVMSTTNIARLATTGSNTFIGNQIVSGSLSVTSSLSVGNINSAPNSENTLNIYSPVGAGNGEGGQMLLGAYGGAYTSASMIDTYQNQFRVLSGTNSGGSNRGILSLNLQTANATFEGTITENSSLRYKENVETVKYGLDKVLQMRGVTYDKKNTGVKELGVIAEEVYDILPEVVLKNEEGEIDSVSYGRITAVLIEAIKDLKKEIEDLKLNR